MTQRNDMTVSKVYEHLAAVPAELNPTVSEVLVACGQFIGTILKEGYADQDRRTVLNWFTKGLESYVNRTSEPAVRH